MPELEFASLREALAGLSKEALLDLLLKACKLDRDVLLLCAVRADPDRIGIQAMVNDAGNAIKEAASAPDFEDYYGAPEPDYADIAKKLRTIVQCGKPDLALQLAAEVFNTCDNAISVYDYEFNIIGGVVEVALAALDALRAMDWQPAQKMIWAIRAMLADDFGYCECFEEWLRDMEDSSAWSEVADYLARHPAGDGWRKSTWMDLRKLALEKAGRSGELMRLYEEQAKEKGDYLELADYLLGQGRDADAEKWLNKALEAPKSPYEAMELRKRLIGIREKAGDLDAAMALRAENFVDSPDVEEYADCAKAAGARWEKLKPLLMRYLEQGKLPWLDPAWPFGIKGQGKAKRGTFPLYGELVELAFYEKRPLDALKWYDEQRGKRGRSRISPILLAAEVKDAAPERSLAIWKAQAETLIAETKSRSYLEAGRYLEQMLALSAKMGDKDRWRTYLGALREQHKRKKNFIKVLDALEQGNSPIDTAFF